MLLLILICAALICYFIITYLTWKIRYDVHVDMVSKYYTDANTKIGNYMNFRDEWDKCKAFMIPSVTYKGAFFQERRYSDILNYDPLLYYYHASIIGFNGVGMILNNMWQYRKVVKFMKKEYKNNLYKNNWNK